MIYSMYCSEQAAECGVSSHGKGLEHWIYLKI